MNTNWFKTEEVGLIQLEISNYCNAACPLCSRVDDEVKGHLNNSYLTIEQIKKWFDYDFKNLNKVQFCGTYDEPTIHPDFLEIVNFFISRNPSITFVGIATNGGTKNKQFWKELAYLGSTVRVTFGIDGLEDTNHIYRQNIKWKKLEENFQTFIKAGGRARWQFILFEHNKHQLEEARLRAKKEGFEKFVIVESNRHDEKSIIKNAKLSSEPEWFKDRQENEIDGIPISKIKKLKTVRCAAKFNSGINKLDPDGGSIYLTHRGYLVPCCWLGNMYQLNEVWKSTAIPKENHNINYHTIEEIINGEMWEHIHNNLQKHKVCIETCGTYEGDKQLGEIFL